MPPEAHGRVGNRALRSEWSEAQTRAYVLADNKLALNAGWDTALLAAELKVLAELGSP
jgi:hypothetical protein